MNDTPSGSLPVIGLALLAFLAGTASSHFGVFPYRQLVRPGFDALEAVTERLRKSYGAHSQLGDWETAPNPDEDLPVVRPDRMAPGYTLYIPGPFAGAKMIDASGRVVHTWRLPFDELWSDPPHISWPVPAKLVDWRDVHLFPSGDLLVVYTADADTPWGYGLAKIDRDSNLLWKAPLRAHHDVEVDSDGTIYTLTNEFTDAFQTPEDLPAGRVLDDHVVELSPDGRVQRRVSLTKALLDSPYHRLWHVPLVHGEPWDRLHPNAIAVAGQPEADRYDFLEPGHLLITLRNISVLLVLDMQAREVVWAERGPWLEPHDAEFDPKGNILLFDNSGATGPGQPSRVLRYDPAARSIVWSYAGSADNPLWSSHSSSQQHLANGNVLITETKGARLLEVTPDREIVWEFYLPVRQIEPERRGRPFVVSGQRFPPEFFEFALD